MCFMMTKNYAALITTFRFESLSYLILLGRSLTLELNALQKIFEFDQKGGVNFKSWTFEVPAAQLVGKIWLEKFQIFLRSFIPFQTFASRLNYTFFWPGSPMLSLETKILNPHFKAQISASRLRCLLAGWYYWLTPHGSKRGLPH